MLCLLAPCVVAIQLQSIAAVDLSKAISNLANLERLVVPATGDGPWQGMIRAVYNPDIEHSNSTTYTLEVQTSGVMSFKNLGLGPEDLLLVSCCIRHCSLYIICLML